MLAWLGLAAIKSALAHASVAVLPILSFHITITQSQLKELSKRTTFIRVTQQLNPVCASSFFGGP